MTIIRNISTVRNGLAAVVLFVLGLFCLDRSVGLVLDSMRDDVKTGQSIGLINAALDRRNSDVIVFGDSRAKHHLDPQRLIDGTSCTGYNAGVEGQGLYYQRILESLMISRGTQARLFILISEPSSLFWKVANRARNMAPFVDENETVRRMVREITPFADIKLQSRAYRYNGSAARILLSAFGGSSGSNQGFIPLHGSLPASSYEKGVKFMERSVPSQIQQNLVDAFRGFIVAAQENGVNVAVVQGPRLIRNPHEEDARVLLESMTQELSVPLIRLDETVIPEFLDPTFYRDEAHLNEAGADIMSRALRDRLETIGLLPESCSGPQGEIAQVPATEMLARE